MLVYLNGEFVPENEAKISIFDRGFVWGDGAYDITRTYRHKIFRLDMYLDRFFESLRYLDIDPGTTREQLAKTVDEVVTRNLPLLSENGDYLVGIRCTRGGDLRTGFKPGKAALMIFTLPIDFSVFASAYTDGTALVTPTIRRAPREVVSPKAKNHSKLNHSLAEIEAKKINPSAQCLMLDLKGNISEGPTWNIAAVVDGALVSPKDNCLEGRTIKILMGLAEQSHIPCSFDGLSLMDLYRASEAFITSTPIVMLPVKSVNGKQIGKSIPGATQEKLWAEWNKMVGFDVRDQARSNIYEVPMKTKS